MAFDASQYGVVEFDLISNLTDKAKKTLQEFHSNLEESKNDFQKFLNFSINHDYYLKLDSRSVYLDNPENDIYELSFKIISFLLKKADLDLEALLLITKTRRSWISIGDNEKFILWESSSRAKQNFTLNSQKIAGVCNYILDKYSSQYRVFIHLIPGTNLLCYRLLNREDVSSLVNYHPDQNKNNSYWQRCFMYLPKQRPTSNELLDGGFSDAQYELVEAES